MGNDHRLHPSENPFSLLQANELFVHKILSRNSSVGRSARLPACRLPGQIPFIWEAQPGLPKDKPSENLHPPPPPNYVDGTSKTPHQVPKQQEAAKIWSWMKPRKKLRNVVKKNGAFGSSSSSRPHVNQESEFCRKSNDESSSSTTPSSLSCISHSLSSSSSSSNGYARRRSKLSSLAKGFLRWAF
ncbi:uncharacterized protein LOC111485037 [Cucurbita maxima]|uniref:Uncharacterized protein LOC111485037 n=1 Tax=Cucurbita maxima TaxID=3661 RepID=A0A6J1JJ17_CUCMA|nr:uncharacterized protein LOC111485037 [Cucurbita maxima]